MEQNTEHQVLPSWEQVERAVKNFLHAGHLNEKESQTYLDFMHGAVKPYPVKYIARMKALWKIALAGEYTEAKHYEVEWTRLLPQLDSVNAWEAFVKALEAGKPLRAPLDSGHD